MLPFDCAFSLSFLRCGSCMYCALCAMCEASIVRRLPLLSAFRIWRVAEWSSIASVCYHLFMLFVEICVVTKYIHMLFHVFFVHCAQFAKHRSFGVCVCCQRFEYGELWNLRDVNRNAS